MTTTQNTYTINSAITRLVEVIQFRSGSSYKISALVWSLWNGDYHVVGLWNCLAGLDAATGKAILRLIQARLEMGGDADPYIKAILDDSGEFDRYHNARDRTPEGQPVPYPNPQISGWRLEELAQLFSAND